MKKVYIAGFDVFYPDAGKRGSKMKMACAEHGFIGLYPLDNEAETAEGIFRGNCAPDRSGGHCDCEYQPVSRRGAGQRHGV